ncbi:putative bifunctional diguanylate cyclase/phosphodiesterase [Limimaricola pyoseonensis]|uniref:Diguanylate cyclase (GGDEF) domain-containing protein n=1 Tax=Limimaricola pyoseonensis TaxID=521013 RepID=A0A1G7CT54_9RHOB|nr:EAL domain-containing protein [Limimaricola pyoseonensis]SDE42433.1 diguanylate cyclase (GGDEF) domain-containing protein [Limimaricola pyoseonensis]
MQRLIGRIRREAGCAMRIAGASRAKRLAMSALMLLLCREIGQGPAALQIAAAIVTLEAVQIAAAWARPARGGPGPGAALAVWGVALCTAPVYLLPSMLLAGQPSVPLMLAGTIWLFGVYAQISNVFVTLPLFYWSQILPGFLMAGVVFSCTPAIAFAPRAPLIEWLVPACLMLAYAAHSYDTLRLQKRTRRALEDARSEAEARLKALEHVTRHDGLTGLLNRRAFDEQLAEFLLRPAQAGRRVAVLLVDLDGFKPINDTYSHEAGDRVLGAVGERLGRIAGETGIAARLGGDEFALAFPALPSAAQAHGLARQVLKECERPVPFEERALRISASVGIAISGPGRDSVTAICAAADQAMFAAKDQGAGRALLYDPATFPSRPAPGERRRLAAALEAGEIELLYKPLVRLTDGEMAGFEAMPRWHHPERGPLGPETLLPLVDDLGLQGEFIARLVRMVLRDIEALLCEGFEPGRVSLDLAAAALATRSGRNDLEQAFAAHPEAAACLTLEITETVFGLRGEGLIEAGVLQLRRAAMRLSLDGIGSGAGSLQQLRRLDFDELKIAPGFVAGLGTDRTSEVLVAALLGVARGLEISAVACGVTTEEQQAQLLRLGCPYGQGPRFGAPMTGAALRERLRARSPAPPALAAG